MITFYKMTFLSYSGIQKNATKNHQIIFLVAIRLEQGQCRLREKVDISICDAQLSNCLLWRRVFVKIRFHSVSM